MDDGIEPDEFFGFSSMTLRHDDDDEYQDSNYVIHTDGFICESKRRKEEETEMDIGGPTDSKIKEDFIQKQKGYEVRLHNL